MAVCCGAVHKPSAGLAVRKWIVARHWHVSPHGKGGVVQIKVTPKREIIFIKRLSISGVTWNWHVLNHATDSVLADLNRRSLGVTNLPAMTALLTRSALAEGGDDVGRRAAALPAEAAAPARGQVPQRHLTQLTTWS
jgi:hypothetical protein